MSEGDKLFAGSIPGKLRSQHGSADFRQLMPKTFRSERVAALSPKAVLETAAGQRRCDARTGAKCLRPIRQLCRDRPQSADARLCKDHTAKRRQSHPNGARADAQALAVRGCDLRSWCVASSARCSFPDRPSGYREATPGPETRRHASCSASGIASRRTSSPTM